MSKLNVLYIYKCAEIRSKQNIYIIYYCDQRHTHYIMRDEHDSSLAYYNTYKENIMFKRKCKNKLSILNNINWLYGFGNM